MNIISCLNNKGALTPRQLKKKDNTLKQYDNIISINY